MAVTGWIVDPTKQDYAQVVGIAAAFAQAFDQAWNDAATLSVYEAEAITSVCSNDFRERGPGPLAYAVYSNPSNWSIAAAACVALILESDAFFASQGLTPPPSNAASGLLATYYAQSSNVAIPSSGPTYGAIVNVNNVNVPANCKAICHFDGTLYVSNPSGIVGNWYSVGYTIGRAAGPDAYPRIASLVPFGSDTDVGVYVPFSYTFEYPANFATGPAVTFTGFGLVLNENTGTYPVSSYSASMLVEVVSV
jgi:hypothetical protein